ncbi:type II toxin-antitoxin system RelE/ParE family toxin [Phenylobacterium montanum]|uniref:type II toxin-antitoxin system RelE/ParE family toxin n=1 Tax=Phenylobacterium montanum TaxID=2823693 RepID=UPI002013A28C|nr:type II toxin-antitoxin system RelE/ParE family toxin [Caulobacter sp. S6]
MTSRIVFSPEARSDLRNLYLFIADRAGDSRALAYVQRIRDYCLSFSTFPERGTRRDDLAPGLRIIGFERRVTIAFHLGEGLLVVDRILYGGRDIAAHLEQD